MVRQAQPPVRWLQFSLALVLALGILYRFANLDQKPYWHDETYTSLRVSGYRAQEVVAQLYQGQTISIGELQHYQQPGSDKSVVDTIQGLAHDEPQHPPLYYGMARLWAEHFGSSVVAMRSLPVLISLLGFPAVYWLCLEFSGSPLFGWLAVALFSVSPIYIRYAQEARQYSLWLVIILLSCVALLRAIRYKTKLGWGFYAATVTAGLYCHLFSGLVFLGHGLYVLAIERFRLSQRLVAYLLSSLSAIGLFLPWLWITVAHQDALIATTNWTKQPLPTQALLKVWGLNLCHAFVSWQTQYNNLLIYLAIPILILILLAVYRLWSQASKHTALFISTLIGVTVLALAVPDLIWSGQRSITDRYFLPCYLGIHLAVANLLAYQISHATRGRFWQIITVLVISGGVLSGAVNAQANTWWGWSEFEVQVSKIINQAPRPLLITDMPLGMVMPLSHRLDSQTQLLLMTEPESLQIPTGFRDVFVYNPSDRLRAELERRRVDPELVYQFRDNSLVVSLYHLS